MKKNGLVRLYLLFVKDMVYPDRVTISIRRDITRKDRWTIRSLHDIKYKKVTSEIQETILDHRLTKRFGWNRIKFRLRRIMGLSLNIRTICKILKRHGLNILKCQTKKREYSSRQMV